MLPQKNVAYQKEQSCSVFFSGEKRVKMNNKYRSDKKISENSKISVGTLFHIYSAFFLSGGFGVSLLEIDADAASFSFCWLGVRILIINI